MLVAEGAGMTSGSDDLEQELRRNLKLRRELGVEAAKGKAALSTKHGDKIAYRLGRVLYWACLIVAAVWAVGLFVATTNGPAGPSQIFVPATFAFIFVPALILYGLGRAFRYVLSGE
jgi:hypothetical protein